MKLNWNFLGGGEVQNKNTFGGGSVDIFCNYTFQAEAKNYQVVNPQ